MSFSVQHCLNEIHFADITLSCWINFNVMLCLCPSFCSTVYGRTVSMLSLEKR